MSRRHGSAWLVIVRDVTPNLWRGRGPRRSTWGLTDRLTRLMRPGQAELEALAERGLTFIDGEGQTTAWWEFRARPRGTGMAVTERVQVALAVVDGPAAGEIITDRTDDEGLRAAVEGARVLCGRETLVQRPARLPEPEPGRTHSGYDPRALIDAERVAATVAGLPWNGHWQSSAAKTAIASTRGVRAYEQRSFAAVHLLSIGGRQFWAAQAATGPDGLDSDALTRDVLEFAGEDAPPSDREVAPGEYPVVLGPWALAALLDLNAWRFGAGTAESQRPKLGTRVAASAINLSDSPRFARTLPRSYDAEGAPVKPTPLIQDGVAHRIVHDATTGTTTGHATAPGAGHPAPRNLVLVGGGAAGAAELAERIDDGLVITSLAPSSAHRLRPLGVRRIVNGELGEPLRGLTISADLFDVLASTEALTSRQWLIPSLRADSARTAS